MKEKITHCKAGALCLPPSNPAGRTENDALPPTDPKFKAAVPTCPAWAEILNPGTRAQHSKVERWWRAPRTVTLRDWARIAEGKMNWRRVWRCILRKLGGELCEAELIGRKGNINKKKIWELRCGFGGAEESWRGWSGISARLWTYTYAHSS